MPEPVDVLNDLFAKLAQNQLRTMVIGIINNNETFQTYIWGRAGHLEKVGLITQMQADLASHCWRNLGGDGPTDDNDLTYWSKTD